MCPFPFYLLLFLYPCNLCFATNHKSVRLVKVIKVENTFFRFFWVFVILFVSLFQSRAIKTEEMRIYRVVEVEDRPQKMQIEKKQQQTNYRRRRRKRRKKLLKCLFPFALFSKCTKNIVCECVCVRFMRF